MQGMGEKEDTRSPAAGPLMVRKTQASANCPVDMQQCQRPWRVGSREKGQLEEAVLMGVEWTGTQDSRGDRDTGLP